MGGGVRAQHLDVSTHHWEVPTKPSAFWSEGWSDVKTPGDGKTYSVGTTWVNFLDMGPATFAGASVSGPTGFPRARDTHVAVLRITGGIQPVQAYFHGDDDTPGDDPDPKKTFARAISVFPGATAAETRIAICGETLDERLPRTPTLPHPDMGGSATANLKPMKGFLAVYDGNASLLWSYHFFGEDQLAATVLTDVAIHVDTTVVPPRDVVTYCGCSTNGVFDDLTVTNMSTMSPLLWHTVPPGAVPPPGCGDVYTQGDVHNAAVTTDLANDWDGIVGRLSAPHANPQPSQVTREFHSIVGGAGRDGLFGITEKSRDEFMVVGVTMPAATPTGSPWTVALTGHTEVCLWPGGGAMHGLVIEFNAAQVPLGLPLLLTGSRTLGSPAGGRGTLARDVLWHHDRYYVVGSTNDPDFLFGIGNAFHTQPNRDAVGNPVATGFVATLVNAQGGANGGLVYASYFADTVNPNTSTTTGLTSVAAWNEYPDHIAVGGWVRHGDHRADLVAANLFRDTTAGPSDRLALLRSFVIEATGDERPAARDSTAFVGGGLFTTGLNGVFVTPSIEFDYTISTHDPFGDFGGGGLAVDSRGRLSLVGSTIAHLGVAGDFPVVGAGAQPQQVGHNQDDLDAVFTVLEMLPDGVCRSDGTGNCPPTSPPWTPTGNGGTTPACALSAFGNLLGMPPPPLHRMFVDYEGTPGVGAPITILVDRPPPSTGVVLSLWQVGVPQSVPIYDVGHDIELWYTMPFAPLAFGVLPTGGSIRETWASWPGLPAGQVYMAQYVCLLVQQLVGTTCTAPDLSWAATPAIAFQYQ